MIRASDASLVYSDHGKEVFACKAVGLELHEGEFVGILGPSGSGKSSLLFLLSGLKTPTSGQISLDNQDINQLSDAARSALRLKSFGFVFQYPYLLGYLSALENVLLARPGEDRRDEALELLEELGIGQKSHRKPHELSGGERQRVCVARALLGSPRAIFADEPTAALDHKNGTQVVELLNQHRGSGTLIMVTHDPSMLAQADRIIQISDGEIVHH
ncbi:MAG: ATP-binding cassette domain-containing protein [Chthonomonas sp.]|nr:ATP-binding cassette domain-containing protein [Chthonomonas sp.]